MGKPDPPGERARIRKARMKEVQCIYCPPHKGENAERRTPRPDRYKTKRKGK